MVRVGTVNAATVPLLIPAVEEFRAGHPVTQVEVVGAQQTDIHRTLLEGGFDLGLVNHLEGDDMPAEFESTDCCGAGPWCACVPTARWPPRPRSRWRTCSAFR
ncbi:hypothetical protein B6E66_38640 [Streptomyces maremycinicus]|nr:hypothetical protein B6E66_38640 [Streptomyces sp. B9173]